MMTLSAMGLLALLGQTFDPVSSYYMPWNQAEAIEAILPCDLNGDLGVDIVALAGGKLVYRYNPGAPDIQAVVPATGVVSAAKLSGNTGQDRIAFTDAGGLYELTVTSTDPITFDIDLVPSSAIYANRELDTDPWDGGLELFSSVSGNNVICEAWDGTSRQPLAIINADAMILQVETMNFDNLGGSEILLRTTVGVEIRNGTGGYIVGVPGTNIRDMSTSRSASGRDVCVISLASNGASYSDQAAIFNSNGISTPAPGVGVAMRGMCLDWYDSELGGGDFLRVLGEPAVGDLSPGDAQVFARVAHSGGNVSSFSNVFFSDVSVRPSWVSVCPYAGESLSVRAACVGDLDGDGDDDYSFAGESDQTFMLQAMNKQVDEFEHFVGVNLWSLEQADNGEMEELTITYSPPAGGEFGPGAKLEFEYFCQWPLLENAVRLTPPAPIPVPTSETEVVFSAPISIVNNTLRTFVAYIVVRDPDTQEITYRAPAATTASWSNSLEIMASAWNSLNLGCNGNTYGGGGMIGGGRQP